jgi:hypothetical protein
MVQRLVLGYRPHPSQKLVHRSKARFKLVDAGRRFGKTVLGAAELLKEVAKSHKGSVSFVVAPTFDHVRKCWTEILRLLPASLVRQVRESDRMIVLVGNRQVWFRSADNPDSLRSQGLDFLWMDECALIKEDAWNLALRPALIDKRGKAVFTTTPKGHNWFFELWTRGQDKMETEYESWMFPTVANPTLDPKEIEAFARDMPEFAYRQEILGEFMEDAGSVFHGVDQCVKGAFSVALTGQSYVLGVDLAKYQDFTVLCVLSMDGHLASFTRFGEVDWVLQKAKIVAKAQEYNNARVLVDSSGVGDPIYDDLRRSGLRVEGFKFTNASKADLIENLIILIEQKKISFPNVPELVNELKLYGYTMTKGGTTQYNAPQGYHDDTVIALALAAWQIKTVSKPAWILR